MMIHTEVEGGASCRLKNNDKWLAALKINAFAERNTLFSSKVYFYKQP